jgi:hypothetical protein
VAAELPARAPATTPDDVDDASSEAKQPRKKNIAN